MSLSRIWKVHTKPFGADKGKAEVFEVAPRARDGKYLVRKAGVKTNRACDYDEFDTLEDVKMQLEAGRAVRMRGQQTRDWNTLNGEGVYYA
ncbi:hypothetical protein ACFOD9_08325 [Novosphingobium bradum]|uniref:Uncharacterized protein n=1 Tax=Novosphingobium bradum TaxID=1737444 RepID=A0ABV7INH7_9SPHN